MAASSCAMAIWLKRESSRIGIKINHIPCLYILILPLSLILSPMGRGKGEGASPLSFFVLPSIHECFILCPSLELRHSAYLQSVKGVCKTFDPAQGKLCKS